MSYTEYRYVCKTNIVAIGPVENWMHQKFIVGLEQEIANVISDADTGTVNVAHWAIANPIGGNTYFMKCTLEIIDAALESQEQDFDDYMDSIGFARVT